MRAQSYCRALCRAPISASARASPSAMWRARRATLLDSLITVETQELRLGPGGRGKEMSSYLSRKLLQAWVDLHPRISCRRFFDRFIHLFRSYCSFYCGLPRPAPPPSRFLPPFLFPLPRPRAVVFSVSQYAVLVQRLQVRRLAVRRLARCVVSARAGRCPRRVPSRVPRPVPTYRNAVEWKRRVVFRVDR